MKKLLLSVAVGAMALSASAAFAADALTLQLKWVAQAQFAGYYVAAKKGYYTDAGLDVTIKPGGPDIAPEQVIAGGGADVIVDWAAAALAARRHYKPLCASCSRNAACPLARKAWMSATSSALSTSAKLAMPAGASRPPCTMSWNAACVAAGIRNRSG